MALSIYPLLNLRQLAVLKLAVNVCDDPEVKDFLKENGIVSVVFPSKEVTSYMHGGEKEAEKIWVGKDLIIDGFVLDAMKRQLRLYRQFFYGVKSRGDTLPFRRWEELIEKKIFSLSLPENLHAELLEIIRIVSLEIDKWVKNLTILLGRSAESIARTSLSSFQWNSLGKIDRAKTASMLINNPKLHFKDRYLIALHYGLQDYVVVDKTKENECETMIQMYKNFYGRGDTGDLWKKCTGEAHLPHLSLQNLFSTWTTNEKVDFVQSLLMENRMLYSDLLMCLAELDIDERIEIFKMRHFEILASFLDWPFQRQFLDAAKLLLPYFELSSFFCMLYKLLYERIMQGRKDFNYIRLLKEFWFQSPFEFKELTELKLIYEPLMFTINYPNEETFPREQIFDSHYGKLLSFAYQGIHYGIFQRDPFLNSDSVYHFCAFRKLLPKSIVYEEICDTCSSDDMVYRIAREIPDIRTIDCDFGYSTCAHLFFFALQYREENKNNWDFKDDDEGYE
ncbi:uncharacterized protein TNCV_4312581 [Trichonephila clavipes]|nr:uncharacterized protein TNCV_4312581 [Trichonephila clavipes]